MSILNIIKVLFEDHKLARRGTLIWALTVLTIVILRFLDAVTQIDTVTASVFVSILGILSTVLVFYNKHRNEEDMK